MNSSDLTIFIHDTSLILDESDDPLTAIVYFNSPNEASENGRCCLCGSLVALLNSLHSFLGSTPTKITLKTQRFYMKKLESITIAIGQNIHDKFDYTDLLQMLVDCIEFKYKSVANMLKHWASNSFIDNISQVFDQIQQNPRLNVKFALQMDCMLLVEDCIKHTQALGACLFYQNRAIHSTLPSEETEKIKVHAMFTKSRNPESDDKSAVESKKAYLHSKRLAKLKDFQGGKKKQYFIKTVDGYTPKNEVNLLCLNVNETSLAVLTEDDRTKTLFLFYERLKFVDCELCEVESQSIDYL